MKEKYKSLPIELKASFWFFVSKILSKGISILTLPLFTRILSSAEYGEYSLFLSWENIITIFATFNLSYQVFNNGMVKFEKKKNDYTSSMIGLTFVLCVLCLLLLTIFYNLWFSITGISYKFLLLMFLNIFQIAIFSFYIIRQRYDYKYKSVVVFSATSSILNPLLAFVLIYLLNDNVFARILATSIVSLILGIITFILLYKSSSHFINRKYWKYALKLDIPLLPHYLSTVLLDGSDKIMIGKMVGKSFTAFYNVSYQISMMLNILLSSINDSYAPWIYRKLKTKDYNIINSNTSKLMLLVAIISILPMLFAPEIVLLVGGEKYLDAVSIIPIVSSSIFMIYLYTLFSFVELFYEKSINITIGSGLASTINIILNLMFIKIYGYKAAAYTTLISYILLALFHYIMMKKVLKEKNINNPIFNNKLIISLCFSIIIFSIFVSFIYPYVLLRYILIFLIVILTLLNKKRITLLLKAIKSN